MTDARALIDQAVAELTQTTTGYKNSRWTTPPAGSHWANGLSKLAQARAAVPAPVTKVVIDASAYPTLRAVVS